MVFIHDNEGKITINEMRKVKESGYSERSYYK